MNNNKNQIEQWILTHHPEIQHLPPDIDLIENRLIDSLRFVEFIFFIESLSGHAIDMSQIQLDDFRSITNIIDKFFYTNLPTPLIFDSSNILSQEVI